MYTINQFGSGYNSINCHGLNISILSLIQGEIEILPVQHKAKYGHCWGIDYLKFLLL